MRCRASLPADCSAARQMRPSPRPFRPGTWDAVSAESITGIGSVEHGVGDVETSARVGAGERIIDSIIWRLPWPAVLLAGQMNHYVSTAPERRHRRLRRRGSPRATMMPPSGAMISSKRRHCFHPLDLGDGLRLPASSVNQLFGHAYAVGRTLGKRPRNRRRCRPRYGCRPCPWAVSAGAERPPPWRFVPLLSDNSPPCRTTVKISEPTTRSTSKHDIAIGRQQDAAAETSRVRSLVIQTTRSPLPSHPGVGDETAPFSSQTLPSANFCRRGSLAPAGRWDAHRSPHAGHLACTIWARST